MKKLFWLGVIGLLLFEIANVYFIMPMPGSQEMNSIDTAYFLYKSRWIIRGVFILFIVAGIVRGNWKRKWVPVLPLLLVGAVAYMANFVMAADHMFYQPKSLVLSAATGNKVDSQRLVLGIVRNGQARAYPIQYLGYHHQVLDEIGGEKILVTYCTVCRTGRAFQPVVNGKPETFRLVGMDHFNAMFEDESSGSWWRQATGEAIAGPRKGSRLPEVLTRQASLATWMRLYPGSTVMQADPAYKESYDSTTRYESGLSRNKLTGTDSLSWNKKSWVVGIVSGTQERAYDWNQLLKVRAINDTLNQRPIVLAVAADNKSFFSFYRPTSAPMMILNDSLYITGSLLGYSLHGNNSSGDALQPVAAYQEFFHSWQTFHPGTTVYK